VYRWETILRTVGLEPLPKIAGRKTRLLNLADLAAGHPSEQTVPPAQGKAALQAVPSIRN
jgi:hypothetical protein